MGRKKGKFLLINLWGKEQFIKDLTSFSEGNERLRHKLESEGYLFDIWCGFAGMPPRFPSSTKKFWEKVKDMKDVEPQKAIDLILRLGAWIYKDGKRLNWKRIRNAHSAVEIKSIFKDTGLNKIFESNEKLPNFEKYDAVGVSLHEKIKGNKHIKGWLSELRKSIKNKILIGGGPILWTKSEEWLKKTEMDIVVSGWGELPLLTLLEETIENNLTHPLKKKEIKPLLILLPEGVYFKDKEGTVYGKGTFLESSDDSIYHDRKEMDRLEISTVEGCPWKCRFCWWSHNVPLEYRDPDKILNVIKNSKPSELVFNDGSFISAHKKLYKRALYFLKEILKMKVRNEISSEMVIKRANIRALSLSKEFTNISDIKERIKRGHEFSEQLNEIQNSDNEIRQEAAIKLIENTDDLLFLIAASKFTGPLVGMESGSNKVLKNFGKGLKLEHNVKTLFVLSELDIRPTFSYIASSPKSTIDDFIKTLKLLLLNYKLVKAANFYINPFLFVEEGTPICIAEQPKKNQKFLHPEDKVLDFLLKRKAVRNIMDDYIEYPKIEIYLEKALNSIKKVFENYKEHVEKGHFPEEYSSEEVNDILKKFEEIEKYEFESINKIIEWVLSK